MERNNKNVLRHMKDRIKSWSGGNSPLWFALQEEKETQRLTDRFGATKNSATATLLQWSKGEQNQMFVQIFGKVAELNWMWKTALEEFSNQYSNYQQHLKVLCDTEKEIDEHNKELNACNSKMVKAKKQWEAAIKKGDEARIIARDDEMKTVSSQYSAMKLTVAAAITKLELQKVTCVQAALKEQAMAFVNLAGKCQAIFTAQRAMTAIFPHNDNTTSASNYQIFFDNLSKLVGSLSKKLGMVPPRDGGLELSMDHHTEVPESHTPPSPPDYGAVNKGGASHSAYVDPEKIAEIKDTGNIGLPVPPRSQKSLEIPSYYYYVTPNETSVPEKSTIETVLGYTEIIGDSKVYDDGEIYADNAEDDEKIYDSVSEPRIPQLQQTTDTDTDLWYAVTVVDKEMIEKDMLRLSRSYSDPQILYSDTESQQLQEGLAEEKPMQSLSLPNAKQLRKSHSTPSSRDATPSPPLVDDLPQEDVLPQKKLEEESLPSSTQLDNKQLKGSYSSPTFKNVTLSTPQSPADHGSSTEALRQQKLEIKSSQSPSLPSSMPLKKSTSLSGDLSPSQCKTDHQALQSQEPQEKLPKSPLLTEAKQIGALQSSPAFRDVTTSRPQSPAGQFSSTEALRPQKSDVKSPQSPLLPSAKPLKGSSLSGGLSSPQNKTDHRALQSQESEKKLLKSSSLTEAKQISALQSSPAFRDVTTSPQQSPADYVSSTEALRPQKSDVKSPRSPLLPSAKLLKGSSSLSGGLSSPQGKTDHLALQPQGLEEEKSIKSQGAKQLKELQSSPTSKDLSVSTLQCKADNYRTVDDSQLQEACPQSAPSAQFEEQHSKIQKKCVKMQSEDSMKTQGSDNRKQTPVSRMSPVQKGLSATHSLDVDDGVPVCSQLSHLSNLSRSLDNPSYNSGDREKETKLSSSVEISSSNDNKPVNQTMTDKNTGLITSTPSKNVNSHSVSQSGNMEELNKEVYSFVANALQPQSEANKPHSSLSNIFKRHCQKFEQLSKPTSPEAPHREKDDAKLTPESSQHQKGTRPQRKRPQLPPRPKEIGK